MIETLKAYDKIKDRDQYICQMPGCFSTQWGMNEKMGLHVYMIDDHKSSAAPENLITLCEKCCGKVMNSCDREYWTRLFQSLMADRRVRKRPTIFFTADLHFNHRRIIQYCNRPFETIEEMNETIIINWNSKVKPADLVYVVGDVGFGKLDKIMRRLNGFKFLIIGSHDKTAVSDYSDYFVDTTPLHRIRIGRQDVILCHYCMRVWPRSHYNSWHLFGHSHNRLQPVGKSLDVGVDGHGFFPWSWQEIRNYMNDRPDNFNYIGKEKQ